MKKLVTRRLLAALLLVQLFAATQPGTAAQEILAVLEGQKAAVSGASSGLFERRVLARYLDPAEGLSVTEAVSYALSHNAELMAARAEVDAARGRLRQAGTKPNPKLDISQSQSVNGPDNNFMVTGSLPLELGGRRRARIRVAERELEMQEQMVAERERQLSTEVRAKFGQALSEARRLATVEDLIALTQRSYTLVDARVTEGRSAPLERNLLTVEVNRVHSQRELQEGKVETALLELRNEMGMNPEDPLRLRGDLQQSLTLPLLQEATERALAERPDLKIARSAEALAEAQIQQARTEGRYDASLMAQYQRMNFGFGVNGIDKSGRLVPVQGIFHYLSIGVSLDLPVRNKNLGTIEAAVAAAEATKRRREFAEQTIKREVATSYARYNRAARALEIYRTGVRGEAKANLNIIRQTYELGSKTLIDYLAEERRYTEVEMSYVDSLLEAYQALVDFQGATAAKDLVVNDGQQQVVMK